MSSQDDKKVAGVSYERIVSNLANLVDAIRQIEDLPPIQALQPVGTSANVKSRDGGTHAYVMSSIPSLITSMEKSGVIQKAVFRGFAHEIELEKQVAFLLQQSKSVNEKAQELEQMLAALEKVQQCQTQAPARAPQAVVDTEKISQKLSAVESIAEDLSMKLVSLEEKKGQITPVQRDLEQSPPAENQTQDQRVTSEAQVWRAKYDDQMRISEDLMFKYQELMQAYDSQAARSKLLESNQTMLQQQVELLSQQSSGGSARERELNEALLQARGEAQEWSEQHQQARGNAKAWQEQYEKAVQEAEASLEQMTILTTKVVELETLVSEKQQEVHLLSQQLTEAQAQKAQPQQEMVEEASMGSVMAEIAALKQRLSNNPRKPFSGPSSVQLPVGPAQYPVRAVSSGDALTTKRTTSPTAVERMMERVNPRTVSPTAVGQATRTTSPIAVERVNPVMSLAPPQATEKVNPVRIVGMSPSPVSGRLVYSPPATNAQGGAPSRFTYPVLATSQVSAAYAQVPTSASEAVGTVTDLSRSYPTLPPSRVASVDATGTLQTKYKL